MSMAPRTLSVLFFPYARWMLPADRNSTDLVSPLLIRCNKAPYTPSTTQSYAQDEDSHVLNAGVGEHAFEVALSDHEHGRNRHG